MPRKRYSCLLCHRCLLLREPRGGHRGGWRIGRYGGRPPRPEGLTGPGFPENSRGRGEMRDRPDPRRSASPYRGASAQRCTSRVNGRIADAEGSRDRPMRDTVGLHP
jgi:hypothetical protein